MHIPILIEPIANNGYRATGGEPLPMTAEGATREEAVANLERQMQARLKNGAELITLNVEAISNPWLSFAGMFKNDPGIEEWKESMAEYRGVVEEDPDYL